MVTNKRRDINMMIQVCIYM